MSVAVATGKRFDEAMRRQGHALRVGRKRALATAFRSLV